MQTVLYFFDNNLHSSDKIQLETANKIPALCETRKGKNNLRSTKNKSQIIIIYSYSLLMLIVNKTTCRSFPYVYLYMFHCIINTILAEKQKLLHFLPLRPSRSLCLCFVSFPLQIMFPFHPYFMVLLLNYALERSKFRPKNIVNQKRKTMECSRHIHTHPHTGTNNGIIPTKL